MEKQANRLEYKFLVPTAIVSDIRRAIAPYVRFDAYSEIRKEKEYTVRSIYYDTANFDCYEEKVEGFLEKKKFRIRGYNSLKECSTVFLEIKRKLHDFIAKDRAGFQYRELDTVFSGPGVRPQACEHQAAARHFLYYYYRRRLLPVVLIVYEREAFYSKFDGHLRITLDKGVRSQLYPTLDMLYYNSGLKYALPQTSILEVKFYRGLPLWIRSLARAYHLQRLAVSKYAICLDSHPDAHKFATALAHTWLPLVGTDSNG